MTIPATAGPTVLTDADFPLGTSVTTTSAPLTVSPSKTNPTKGTIDVLVSSDAFSDPKIYSLTISFKVADDWDQDAADLLTAAWSSVSPYVQSASKWTLNKPSPGVFAFTGGGKFEPNETIRVRLDNVPVSTKMGITTVSVAVRTTNTSPTVNADHPLGKFPSQFKLTDFHADEPIVQRGSATNIRWTVAGDTDVKYTFYINGTDSGLPSSQIQSPLNTKALFTTTVYKLVAEYQLGSERPRYETATTVFVNNGDVTTENLTAKKATIAGLLPNCVKTLIKLDQFQVTTQKKGWESDRWEGVGDGLLIIALSIKQKSNTSETIKITLNADRVQTIEVSSDKSKFATQSLVIPVLGLDQFSVEMVANGTGKVRGNLRVAWISLTDNYTPPPIKQ